MVLLPLNIYIITLVNIGPINMNGESPAVISIVKLNVSIKTSTSLYKQVRLFICGNALTLRESIEA
jgi:hypothetical protein